MYVPKGIEKLVRGLKRILNYKITRMDVVYEYANKRER